MVKYIAKRFAMMVLSLLLLSFISFVIIELPPGDYLTLYVKALELRGEKIDDARLESMKIQYGLDKPFLGRYFTWLTGIVFRGNFGRSFQWRAPVSELIAERLPFTILTSVATMLFTFAVAIPIGIYSATHQYSIGDYIATVFGFVGLAVPSFLLALILMYLSFTQLGIPAGGLFSEEYQNAPWSIGRVLDLLQHMIVPVVVVGLAGTAANIRTIRATLLDELGKDYVETARVKGLKESRLIMKYPVRVALNPLWSSIGWLLPAIISGNTIVAVVLNLPTIGPLFLGALMGQDMYLAGSIVFILTTLTLVGTFISDIVLAISDPRIRYE